VGLPQLSGWQVRHMQARDPGRGVRQLLDEGAGLVRRKEG
jgi:hypothetical protein